MAWTVLFHDDFEPEFEALAVRVQDELLAHALLLKEYGPQLGRPTVDTLKGSTLSHLKELRFTVARQQWRVAFAFDPARQAVLLVAGDKTGANQKLFYERMIKTAEHRYKDYLNPTVQASPFKEKPYGKNLDEKLAALPVKRRAGIETRAAELATLKDLREATAHTQQELALALGVGQDTISRLEKRSDMLLSTLRRYVEGMGGTMDIVVKFPNRPQMKLTSVAQR